MSRSSEERALKQERLHPGIFALPVLAFMGLAIPTLPAVFLLRMAGSMMQQFVPQQSSPNLGFVWIPVILVDAFPAVIAFIVVWLAYSNSEITLTNRRLIYRTGMLFRASGEIPLENVEGIFLVEPLLGRILGYGTVMISTIGGLRLPLHYLGKPQVFHAALQNAVNSAKSPTPPVRKSQSVLQDDSRYMPKG